MIVHQPHRLHKRIARGFANKDETTFFKALESALDTSVLAGTDRKSGTSLTIGL